VRGRFALVRVRRCPEHDRHKGNLAMGDAVLGDHRLSKFSYRGGIAAQHGDFETALMVEMNMQRRDLQLVVRVICPGQPLGEFPGVVVENIRKRRNAFSGDAVVGARPLEAKTRKIADRLRPVLIVMVSHEHGELGRKLVSHADRDSLHISDSRV